MKNEEITVSFPYVERDKLPEELKGLDPSLFERESKEGNIEEITGDQLSFLRDIWLRFSGNKASVVGLIVLVLIILVSFIGPLVGPYGYSQPTKSGKVQGSYEYQAQGAPYKEAPFFAKSEVTLYNLVDKDSTETETYEKEATFIFGTDEQSRDLWTRVWRGVRTSLTIGFVATIIDVVIGVTYGAISGYIGGKLDLILQRIIEVLGSIPNLVIIILMLSVLDPGIFPIIFSIALTGWIGMSRMVRGQVLRMKQQEYVLAAQTIGFSDKHIIFKHIMPNILGVIVVWLMFTIPGAIFYETFLSFIGLGVPIPDASLGSLINDGLSELQTNAYLTMIPAIVLSVIMLSFNMIADGLRDAVDPKSRGGH